MAMVRQKAPFREPYCPFNSRVTLESYAALEASRGTSMGHVEKTHFKLATPTTATEYLLEFARAYFALFLVLGYLICCQMRPSCICVFCRLLAFPVLPISSCMRLRHIAERAF